jgi:hypothetical protein
MIPQRIQLLPGEIGVDCRKPLFSRFFVCGSLIAFFPVNHSPALGTSGVASQQRNKSFRVMRGASWIDRSPVPSSAACPFSRAIPAGISWASLVLLLLEPGERFLEPLDVLGAVDQALDAEDPQAGQLALVLNFKIPPWLAEAAI